MIKLIQGNGGNTVGFLDIEFDFFFCRKRMDHIGNGAHKIDRIKHDDGLGAVGHTNGDAVALPDADGFQGTGTSFYIMGHFFV